MIIIKRIWYYLRYIFILCSILCSIMLLIRCTHVTSVHEPQDVTEGKSMDDITITDCIGISNGQHVLSLSGTQTQIEIAPDPMKDIRKSFDQVLTTTVSDQILLVIENVRGTADANILNVLVNQKEAGRFSLYGLDNASRKEQGGKGLSFTLDITEIMKELHLSDTLDLHTVDVDIQPRGTLSKAQDITIEKIKIYRVRQKS